jgi:hypothetical protein
MEVVSKGSKHSNPLKSIRSQSLGGYSKASKKPSIIQSQASKKTNVDESSSFPFDLYTHKAPKIDNFGYNKETHKGTELLSRDVTNVLKEGIKIPQWWQGPTKGRDRGYLNRTLCPGTDA